MANETQQWAAVQLARIRRDSGEYEYQRSKARAQQDVEFTKGLAATAREGKLMASPGIRAAELAGIPLGFMGPIGAGISTVGYGALGAARVGEGLQRRAEGLPYGSEVGWGLADVAMPFVGPAYRAIKGRIPKKGVPEMLRRPLPEPVGSDPVRLRMPEGESLLTPEQQKIHQQNVAKGLKELDSRKGRRAFGKDMGLEVDALPQGSAPQTVFRGRLLGATPPQRTHAPVTMTTEGPALLTRGGLKPKINLADPQSWTHLPGELPPIPRPATPRFAAGRQLPKYFDEPARVYPDINIAIGTEGLNVDRPRGYIPPQPDDLTKTGAARTAVLPPRDPAGLKQWDTVKEPLTTQGGKIPRPLQRLGPDHSGRQPLGGGPVQPGKVGPWGTVEQAYEAYDQAKIQAGFRGLPYIAHGLPRGREAVKQWAAPGTPLREAQDTLARQISAKYEYRPPRKDKREGKVVDIPEAWVDRETGETFARRLHPGKLSPDGSPSPLVSYDPWDYYGLGFAKPTPGGGGPRPFAGKKIFSTQNFDEAADTLPTTMTDDPTLVANQRQRDMEAQELRSAVEAQELSLDRQIAAALDEGPQDGQNFLLKLKRFEQRKQDAQAVARASRKAAREANDPLKLQQTLQKLARVAKTRKELRIQHDRNLIDDAAYQTQAQQQDQQMRDLVAKIEAHPDVQPGDFPPIGEWIGQEDLLTGRLERQFGAPDMLAPKPFYDAFQRNILKRRMEPAATTSANVGVPASLGNDATRMSNKAAKNTLKACGQLSFKF
jgi:hypothetical protein